MRNRFIVTAFFSLIWVVTLAQIEGVVVDKNTGRGLSKVELYELKTGNSIITDDHGNFKLSNLSDSIFTFLLLKEGYHTIEYTLSPGIDKYTLFMEKLSINLSEIQLIDQRKELFATKKLKDVVGTHLYAGKKTEVIVLDLIHGNTAANVSRQIYAQIGGLNIYEGSDGGLQLNIGGRGLDPNRTSNFNTRQNGYDISADVLGYPESYYTPPADALEEIRITRGASSLQYGTQFGGVIDFRIKKIPHYKKWQLETKLSSGSFGLFNNHTSFGINKNGYSLSGFYSFKKGDGYRENSDFHSHNAFLSSTLPLSQKSILTLEFTYFNYLAKQAGGLTDLQFESNPRMSTRSRNWFDVDWKLFNANFKHNFSPNRQLELNLFGLDASRKSLGFRGNPIALNENPILAIDEQDSKGNHLIPRDLILGKFKNHGAELRFLNNYNWNSIRNALVIGAKYYNSSNSAVQGPGSIGTDADFSLRTNQYPDYANQSNFDFPNLNFAIFAENAFYINTNLSITPGLRWEYISTKSDGSYHTIVHDLAGNPLSNQVFEESKDFTRSFLLAGIGMDYKWSKKWKWTANISQNYRSVTFSDIRVVNPSFIIDKNITDENGYSFSTGITGRPNRRLSIDFTLFSILYNDRIGIILDDRANRVRTNIGDAAILGTESLINYIPIYLVRENKKYLQLKTFLNSAITTSKYLNSQSNNVVDKRVEFIPLLNLKAGLSIDFKNFGSTIQYSYNSQQYTDAQNSLALGGESLRSGLIGEIPSYHIVDLSFHYDWGHFKLQSGINNLLDYNYFTRRVTGYPGPGIIPSEGRSYFCTIGYKISR